MAEVAHRRYAEIMKDIEDMIDDHSMSISYESSLMRLMKILVEHQRAGLHHHSKLKLLVPSIGIFFTRLPLADAFKHQDRRRFISSRRFVPPSFNDVRLILNTAQIMGMTTAGPLDLATFDGDVTLYDDGKSLEPDNEVISRIIGLMSKNTKIGIVTAAGYTEAEKYYGRLYGLLDAIRDSVLLTPDQKQNLVVMG
jgi:IMP and pyridine-specific 5'-nucleotidase